MNKIITIIIAVMMMASITTSAQKLSKVLKNYYEVNGIEKLLTVKNMGAEGNSIQFGMESPFKNIITSNGKFYLEVPVQGQLMKQGYNGEDAWIVMPWTGSDKPIDLGGPQRKAVRIQADITGMLYDYEKKGYETELLEKEDLEGTEVFVVKQTDKDGDTYTSYIDADNYVLLKMTTIMQVQGNEIEVETLMSNYKPYEGVMMAYNIEVKVDGQVQRQIIVEKVTFDIELDESIFDKPGTAAPEKEVKEKKE